MDARKRSGPPIATPLAFVAVALSAFVCALFPLTGTPGPEAAQVLSIVGGPFFMVAAAARAGYQKERGFRGDLLVQLAMVFMSMAVFVLIISIASLSHPSCAPGRGYLPFVFVAFPTLLLNSCIGLFIGRTLGSPRFASITAAFVLLAYIGWTALDWYFEPSFRVLTHLLVLIEGDHLEGRAISPAAVAFRGATALFCAALIVAGSVRFPRARRGGLSSQPGPSPTLLGVALGLLTLGVVVHREAKSVLQPSGAELTQAYSYEATRGLLHVHADPLVTSKRDVDAILAEGTLWLARLEDRLGVAPKEELHIWLHADARAMGRFTGAEHVHFALPNRGELHIYGSHVPHPTLGHELAHLLASQLTTSMFGVPTRFGLFPNAGIIEGLAMAVTPELEVHDGLTLREKAAALRRAGLAPPLADLFQSSVFGFWRHAPRNAYITAGAFVESIAAHQGKAGLAKLYQQGSVRALFNTDEDLERFISEHEVALDALALPVEAMSQVAHRYHAPSILDQTCDPSAETRANAVRAAANTGDFDLAEQLAHEAEGKTLSDKTLGMLARAATALADDPKMERYTLARLDASEKASPASAASLNDVGDLLWRTGRRREAMAHWERISDEALSPGAQRLRLAKRTLASILVARPEGSPVAAASMRLLLEVHTRDIVPALTQIAASIGGLSSSSTEPEPAVAVGEYLLARQYLQRGAPEAGVDLLLRALQHRDGLPEALRNEARRQLALGHALRGDFAIAEAGFGVVAEEAERAATRIQMRDSADRVARMRKAGVAPDETHGDRWLLGRSAH